MKKNLLTIAVCTALTIAFTGCQSDSSSPKAGMPKIDFSKSSLDNATSFSPVKDDNKQESSKSNSAIIDIPETSPYAFGYKYDATMGGMVVTDYYKESPKVNIPSEFEGEPVVCVDFSSLDKDITTLVLPNGTKDFYISSTIQKSLSYLYIPTTVKTIEDHNFNNSTQKLTVIYDNEEYDNRTIYFLIDTLRFGRYDLSIMDGELYSAARYLTEVTVPDDVVIIQKRAFKDCFVLTEFNLPNGLVMISDEAFSGCTELREITIPSGTRYIGEEAFKNCRNLNNVFLPDDIEFVWQNAFDGAKNVNIIFKNNSYDYTRVKELCDIVNKKE